MMTANERKQLQQVFEQQEKILLQEVDREGAPVQFSAHFEQRMERLLRHPEGSLPETRRIRVRRWLVLAAVLALMAALAMAGSALLQTFDVEDYKEVDGYFNETAEKYLSTMDLFNNKVNVHYVDTITKNGGIVLDRYVDETGNEYSYYTDGALRSVYPCEETSEAFREKVVAPIIKGTDKLSEKQAKELGEKILKEFVGEDFANYQFYLLENIETTEMYYVHYAKIYSGDYLGERCMAAFTHTGELHLLNNKGTVTLRDFDTSVLTDELDKELDEFTVEQFRAAECADKKFINYELKEKMILEKDGKIGVQIKAFGNYSTERNLKTFFYPFPGQTGDVVK